MDGLEHLCAAVVNAAKDHLAEVDNQPAVPEQGGTIGRLREALEELDEAVGGRAPQAAVQRPARGGKGVPEVMTPEQAYDQLHELITESGNASDHEALDTIWVATGKANDQLERQYLLDRQSRAIRKRQGRTIGGLGNGKDVS